MSVDPANEIRRIWRLVLTSFAFLVATMIALAALQGWATKASNQKTFGVLSLFECNTPFTLFCTGPDPRSFMQGVLVPSPTLNSSNERVVTLTSNPDSAWLLQDHQLRHVQTGYYLTISSTENSVICVHDPDPKTNVVLFNTDNACICKVDEFVLDFEEVAQSNEEVRGVASRRFQPVPNLSIAVLN